MPILQAIPTVEKPKPRKKHDAIIAGTTSIFCVTFEMRLQT